MNAVIPSNERCQVKTHEGKRCRFTASSKVGGQLMCGNHANKAKETQLKSSAPTQIAIQKGELTSEQEYQLRKEWAGQKLVNTPATDFLKTLRTLLTIDAPEHVLAAMLQAWKAGEL